MQVDDPVIQLSVSVAEWLEESFQAVLSSETRDAVTPPPSTLSTLLFSVHLAQPPVNRPRLSRHLERVLMGHVETAAATQFQTQEQYTDVYVSTTNRVLTACSMLSSCLMLRYADLQVRVASTWVQGCTKQGGQTLTYHVQHVLGVVWDAVFNLADPPAQLRHLVQASVLLVPRQMGALARMGGGEGYFATRLTEMNLLLVGRGFLTHCQRIRARIPLVCKGLGLDWVREIDTAFKAAVFRCHTSLTNVFAEALIKGDRQALQTLLVDHHLNSAQFGEVSFHVVSRVIAHEFASSPDFVAGVSSAMVRLNHMVSLLSVSPSFAVYLRRRFERDTSPLDLPALSPKEVGEGLLVALRHFTSMKAEGDGESNTEGARVVFSHLLRRLLVSPEVHSVFSEALVCSWTCLRQTHTEAGSGGYRGYALAQADLEALYSLLGDCTKPLQAFTETLAVLKRMDDLIPPPTAATVPTLSPYLVRGEGDDSGKRHSLPSVPTCLSAQTSAFMARLGSVVHERPELEWSSQRGEAEVEMGLEGGRSVTLYTTPVLMLILCAIAEGEAEGGAAVSEEYLLSKTQLDRDTFTLNVTYLVTSGILVQSGTDDAPCYAANLSLDTQGKDTLCLFPGGRYSSTIVDPALEREKEREREKAEQEQKLRGELHFDRTGYAIRVCLYKYYKAQREEEREEGAPYTAVMAHILSETQGVDGVGQAQVKDVIDRLCASYTLYRDGDTLYMEDDI
ncbi:hypothetical protein KIPB_005863 [Kipferlia bialata]|uniref:Cullin family profile domain-containing protein n=1 Tax=Kipferlia bialata TaxID=797122 RepID=A0A9K3CXM5_9EUKA|nr:hypothetical protein KIPB_005863 [Kipferlia bialata]|eukprot:g5863.t1